MYVVKQEEKVKLVLYFHHAMQTYGGSEVGLYFYAFSTAEDRTRYPSDRRLGEFEGRSGCRSCHSFVRVCRSFLKYTGMVRMWA
jgi:hypothetical protein